MWKEKRWVLSDLAAVYYLGCNLEEVLPLIIFSMAPSSTESPCPPQAFTTTTQYYFFFDTFSKTESSQEISFSASLISASPDPCSVQRHFLLYYPGGGNCLRKASLNFFACFCNWSLVFKSEGGVLAWAVASWKKRHPLFPGMCRLAEWSHFLQRSCSLCLFICLFNNAHFLSPAPIHSYALGSYVFSSYCPPPHRRNAVARGSIAKLLIRRNDVWMIQYKTQS